LTYVVEPFVGLAEQAPALVEQVVPAPSGPERLNLDTTTTLIELGVSDIDHMERVSDKVALGAIDSNAARPRPERSQVVKRTIRARSQREYRRSTFLTTGALGVQVSRTHR